MEIVYSDSVKNVLDRLYLDEVAIRGRTIPEEYNECIEAIESLKHSVISIRANRPLCWAREGATIICPNRYWFSYKRFPNAILIDEVYDTQTDQIITEGLQRVLSLIERIEKI